MKTTRKFGMFGFMLVALLSTVAFVGCDKDDDKPTPLKSYTISGDANGSQVVPSVTGTGAGTVSGTYDPNTNQLSYTSTWTGLSGAPTSAGFYNGASGAAGTAVGTAWSIDPAATGSGTYSGTMTLTPDQANQLTSGQWYYSYGTAANTSGEVRGQITATQQQ